MDSAGAFGFGIGSDGAAAPFFSGDVAPGGVESAGGFAASAGCTWSGPTFTLGVPEEGVSPGWVEDADAGLDPACAPVELNVEFA